MATWVDAIVSVLKAIVKKAMAYLSIKNLGKKEAQLEELKAYAAEQEKLQGLRKEYERIDANSNRSHSRDPIIVRLRDLGLETTENDKEPK